MQINNLGASLAVRNEPQYVHTSATTETKNTCTVDGLFTFTKQCAVCDCECCDSQAQPARLATTYIEPNLSATSRNLPAVFTLRMYIRERSAARKVPQLSGSGAEIILVSIFKFICFEFENPNPARFN